MKSVHRDSVLTNKMKLFKLVSQVKLILGSLNQFVLKKEDRSNQERVSDHELVIDHLTVLILRIKHPERPDEWKRLLHRLTSELDEKGIYNPVLDALQASSYRRYSFVFVQRRGGSLLSRVQGRGAEEVELREEGGQLPPPDEQLLVGDGGAVSQAADGAGIDKRVTNYTCKIHA